MMNIGNPLTWVKVSEGNGWTLAEGRERRVTVDVRATYPTPVYLVDDDGEMLFLARVETAERVRFQVPAGQWAVVADQEIYVRSIEMERASVKPHNGPVFTKLWERKPRNPALEEMMGVVMANMASFQTTLQDEMKRKQEAAERRHRQEIEALKAKGKEKADDKRAGGAGAESAPEEKGRSKSGGTGDGGDAEAEKSADASAGSGDE
jgi:hypothetical protein